MNLQTSISDAGRVYKMYAARLAKLKIFTLSDFLYHIPTRYENYSLLSKIGHVQEGEVVTLKGRVVSIKNGYINSRFRTIQKATIADETGSVQVTWFNQPYLVNSIREKDLLSVAGKVDMFHRKPTMTSPDYEVILPNSHETTIHTGRLVPIYPETRGVTSKWIRKQIYQLLLEFEDTLIEYMPQQILEKNNLMSFPQAMREVHFPKSLDSAQSARKRLAFDELFLLQLTILQRKSQWGEKLSGPAFAISEFKNQIDSFWELLPFTLTQAQRRAVSEIFKDLASKKPMNRLLQGDVGSGKTVVATIAMYLAYLNGYQSVLMAPTEILANQHHKTVSDLLSPLGVKVGLATGSIKYLVSSSKNKKKPKIHDTKYMIRDTFDILVGTHAVLSEKIQFDKLGLVVIDEQQRFGVEQRGIIRSRGKNPHLLTMTATPIPRTVALTLYGDLDMSYLDEMPKGRRVVKTWLVPSEKRDAGYEWIRKEIKKTKSQAFIICPFIEESENMQTVKAATKEYERLKEEIFPDLQLGLLHGRLKAREKDEVLTQFRSGAYDILVATPVVEVGIDIPNATIMLIEASERFGLAQLHQLRGRVGRGSKQSYCLLYTESRGLQTNNRLKAMETIYVGSELAELDLKLRGPGELYGVMQSGRRFLKVASFSDLPLIEKARNAAERLYPHISDYQKLAEKLQPNIDKVISPD
ncbi:MAG: ATP-dependent DNA helicase RecG [Candidatus Levybacteria bacterium]|nr:ATP-dependent DNA helicase RecG [Candidatus Levybacteria bacterium]